MVRNKKSKAEEVQRWFKEKVTYEGEAYVIDLEQAAAVADESKNAIVVARAGSGKTRTIVAKIVYLVAKCRVKPEEIMAFVFNANAAKEINERLSKMRVDGEPVMGARGEDEKAANDKVEKNVKIASTFHAFSRKIIYEVSEGKEKCGEILAEKKDDFVLAIVCRMIKDKKWGEKIREFMLGPEAEEKKLTDEEVLHFSRMMASFINRAQQRFLGGGETLAECAEKYLGNVAVDARGRQFIEIGMECFKRYHWFLLDEKGKNRLAGFEKYGTDFNLIVSWASRIILRGGDKIESLLANKKYILIDEYQDFSQLFLAAVMAVREVARDAKLFVVGDDWQAINRFAGSDVEYFKEFEKYFPEDCRRFEISTNYRCNYVIVDTARKFMQKSMREKGHFKAKSWRAGKVVIVNPRETKLYELIKREKKAKSILILHRNNETQRDGSLTEVLRALKEEVVKRKIMKKDEFDEKVKIMTMHKSKGLEAEVVIILEADEGVIPKTHPDTILYSMFGETEKVAMDDQKRLFYVAMTRAKKRLYIIHKPGNDGFIKFLGRGVEKMEEIL